MPIATMLPNSYLHYSVYTTWICFNNCKIHSSSLDIDYLLVTWISYIALELLLLNNDRK